MTHRIVIGASKQEWLPAQVLRYSILRRASCEVKIDTLCNDHSLVPKSSRKYAATAFSFARLCVPEFCEFKGIAAYLDSDIVCLADIAELFEVPFPKGKTVNSIPDWQTAVMVLDCERTPWRMSEFAADLESGKRKYGQLMNLEPDFPYKANTIPREWNTFDRMREFGEIIDAGDAKLVHYTNMAAQPHLKTGHPYGDIFEQELISALSEGFITPNDIIRECLAEHVRPSLSILAGKFPLVDETTGRVYDDVSFVPPYKRAKK